MLHANPYVNEVCLKGAALFIFKMSSEANSDEMNGVQNDDSQEKADDQTHKKSLELQEQSLGPLKEDLAEWIAKTLGTI